MNEHHGMTRVGELWQLDLILPDGVELASTISRFCLYSDGILEHL